MNSTNTKIEPRPVRRAACWLLFLGPFFFLSYGFANWWTSRLPQVESIWFSWEKHIPFWEWTILPYMSIDAFYAASLFVCATRLELDTHAKRLLAATLISVAGFIIFPLQFSFERPPTSGFNGALFEILTGFDKPFNQAPSLHISLLLLLWILYARHLSGLWRWLMHGWFFAIGLSVMTTFQHHSIDILTGAIVGVFCVYLFPDAPHKWRFTTDNKTPKTTAQARASAIQRYYLLGTLACFGFARINGGWAWLLIWPGIALLLVALGYGWLGVGVFQKHHGRISWPARALLWPYQIGAWISSRWFTRAVVASAEVVPGVWIGRAPEHSDWEKLDAAGVLGVLDLTAEFHASASARRRKYMSVPMLDLIPPALPELQAAVEALHKLCASHDEGQDHAPVLVHCALGYSRSALVIAAWLIDTRKASTCEAAVKIVRAARPQIVLGESYMLALKNFQARTYVQTKAKAHFGK